MEMRDFCSQVIFEKKHIVDLLFRPSGQTTVINIEQVRLRRCIVEIWSWNSEIRDEKEFVLGEK